MTAEANRRGIVDAARAALYEHGIDIRAPWDCDLDDLEREHFNGLNAAVDAILSAALTPPQTEPGGTVREALEAAFDFLGGVDDASEIRDKLLRALSATPATEARVDGWQDISTAERRGDLILLALKHGAVRQGYWGTGRYNRSLKAYERGWCTRPGYIVEATHWRPLPAPPSLTQPEARDAG